MLWSWKSEKLSSLVSEVTEKKWKEEREGGIRNEGKKETWHSVNLSCASIREHLLIRKRTRADSSGWTQRATVSGVLSPHSLWEQWVAWDQPQPALFAGRLTEACATPCWDPSQGPPASAPVWPSLSLAGPWDGILTVGTTDVRLSVSQLCGPGLKSTSESEKEWGEGKETKMGPEVRRWREEKISISCTDCPLC